MLRDGWSLDDEGSSWQAIRKGESWRDHLPWHGRNTDTVEPAWHSEVNHAETLRQSDAATLIGRTLEGNTYET